MIRVKVCGIRSEADLAVAVTAGADAVGFICGVTHRSEDALSAATARVLARSVPPFLTRVLVTHWTDPDGIGDLAAEVGADHVQVHGLVTLEALRAVRRRMVGRQVIGVVHVGGPDAVQLAEDVARCCDAVLLDTRTDDRLGGTGQTHDWRISATIAARLAAQRVPVILAGGLSPGNVQAAARLVRPYAVDVNSGVEDTSGAKSATKVGQFIALARSAGPGCAASPCPYPVNLPGVSGELPAAVGPPPARSGLRHGWLGRSLPTARSRRRR